MTKKILFLGLLVAGLTNAWLGADSLKDCVGTIPMLVRIVNRIAPKDHSYKSQLQQLRDYNYYFNGEDDNKLKYRFDSFRAQDPLQFINNHLNQSHMSLPEKDLSFAEVVGQNVIKPTIFLGIHQGLNRLSKVEQLKRIVPTSNEGTFILAGSLTEFAYNFNVTEEVIGNPEMITQEVNRQVKQIGKSAIICLGHKTTKSYTDALVEKYVGEGFKREALKCVANIVTMQVISIGVNSCIPK